MAYNPATYGSSLINQVSVAHGANTAAIVDMTAKTAGILLCQLVTASSAITVATTFSLYRLSGQTASSPITTLSAGPSSGATSISVVSATYIPTKCTILLIPAAGGAGELVTVTNVSGTTLTVNALINAYSSGAYVFVMEQTATGGTIAPSSSTGTWAATTEYSASIYPPSFVQGAGALWAIVASNGDASNSVTITVNLDYCA
jgi:hypothetical protein